MMEAGFWLKKWELGETGFHQESVNESLRDWWPSVAAPAGGAVLVPLCGKSLDMCWLADQGHEVVGVEVSPVACAAFFKGLGLNSDTAGVGAVSRCSAAALTGVHAGRLLFRYGSRNWGRFAAFYDRAALVQCRRDLQPATTRAQLVLLPSAAPGE